MGRIVPQRAGRRMQFVFCQSTLAAAQTGAAFVNTFAQPERSEIFS
jgi:hypothetical protein